MAHPLPMLAAPMAGPPPKAAPGDPPRRLEAVQLDVLLGALKAAGHEVVGPRVRDGAIVYDVVQRAQDLPQGVSDEQEAGRYRLTQPGHQGYFEYAVGPHSWKRALFPPNHRQWTAERDGDGEVRFAPDAPDDCPRAFVGVRACEVAAIDVQDRVFRGGRFADGDYVARRGAAAIVAVQCTAPAATCFCTSMGTGPHVTAGFDLALTEVGSDAPADGDHYFVVRVGSPLGARVLASVPTREATDDEQRAAEARVASAAGRMTRRMDTAGLPELLARSYDSPHWNAVGDRCLTCTNCTLACPTCFCSTVDDVPLLDGERAERWRRWDSCFTTDFSYIHGGAVRQSSAARYRQWLTHKLGTWWDQFGMSGCVGCGRCITWCPVGIDLTAEVAALQGMEGSTHAGARGAEEDT